MTKATKSLPTFSSPELQKAFEDSRYYLDNADTTRNLVSEDIKGLEAYLEATVPKAVFRHSMGLSLEKPDGEMSEAAFMSSVADCGSGAANIREKSLLWGKDANGRTRLLYEDRVCTGYFDVDTNAGPYFPDWGNTLGIEVKPLIECKFEVRKEAHGHLAEFLTGLKDSVHVPSIDGGLSGPHALDLADRF